MVTAAGVAHANRLPLLLLPGDTFTSRAPDPVLQQVEHFDDPTATVNDAFRAVSRYFDRITRPEQLSRTLPQVARVLTDPADAARSPWRCRRTSRPRPSTSRTRCSSRSCTGCCARAPTCAPCAEAAAASARPQRPLLVLGGGVRYSGAAGRALRFRRSSTASRSSRPPRAARWCRTTTRCTPVRSASPARRRRTPGRRGRPGPRRRHPAAGLHHRVLDGVLPGRPAGDAERRPVRRGEARRAGRRRRRRRGPARTDRRTRRLAGRPPTGPRRRPRRTREVGLAHRLAARAFRTVCRPTRRSSAS